MTRTMGQFWATVLLFALPAIVAAVRWKWESKHQRASTAMSASVAALIAACSWWVDVFASSAQNVWMVSCLVIMPIMVITVLLRGRPFLALRADLEASKLEGLTRASWVATGGFTMTMIGAMAIIWDRLIVVG